MTKNLVELLPNPDNKYTVNSIIKYYEHLIQCDHFNLASFSKSSILTILKATQDLKGSGLDNLSGCFLKGGANFLSKPISDLCNLSITSQKFPDSCKIAKLKPFYEGSLTLSCNSRAKSLLPLISENV